MGSSKKENSKIDEKKVKVTLKQQHTKHKNIKKQLRERKNEKFSWHLVWCFY